MTLNVKAAALLDHLRCPRTGQPLRLGGDEIVSKDGAQRYPIVNGKPVLVREIRDLHITPPAGNLISKNSNYYKPKSPVTEGSWVLHFGCGEVPSNEPNVFSLDILPTHAADIVAEGEALPFADNIFGAVESVAVFEHVYDPFAVLKECRRIVKEGGYFLTDTAFMQPYHGFPAHYFNMTPVAVERYFADDMELVSSKIGPNANPGTATLLTLERLMLAVGHKKAAEFKDMKVGQFIDALRENRRNPTLNNLLSAYHMRGMATGTAVLARKPIGYRERHHALEGENAATMTALKNDYYELRQQIMWVYSRIGEIDDEIQSLGGEYASVVPLSELDVALTAINRFDRLDLVAWQEAVVRLKAMKMTADGALILWQRALSKTRAAAAAK